MIISDDKTIKNIKDEFSKKFPYLKLEFYSKEHEEGEGSKSRDVLDENLTLKAVRVNHAEGDLSIDGHLKVSTLENNFKEKYGVNVQVFRKSGKIYLQTTTTDGWTLAEQQREAEEYELND